MPTWKKIIYGAGDSGFSLTSTALALLYLDFLVNVVGLDPRLAGLAIAFGRIWDAINDLFIGNLSDRTRSRWGRRRPYLLFGAIPFGVAFIFMWFVPAVGQEALLVAFYTGIYMLFDTVFTLTNVPYVALTPELAPTYDGRTSLQAYRMAFSIGFGLLGAVVPLALVDRLAGPDPTQAALRSAYLGMATILAVVSVIPILLTFATVRERPEFQALPQPTLRDALRLLASNKAFLIAAGVYLLTWMPIDLIQFILVFLIRDYFGLGSAERDLIFLLLFGVAILALPLWVRAAARWNKVRAYQVGIALLAGVLILLSFTPPGRSTIVFVLAALAGIHPDFASRKPSADDLDGRISFLPQALTLHTEGLQGLQNGADGALPQAGTSVEEEFPGSRSGHGQEKPRAGAAVAEENGAMGLFPPLLSRNHPDNLFSPLHFSTQLLERFGSEEGVLGHQGIFYLTLSLGQSRHKQGPVSDGFGSRKADPCLDAGNGFNFFDGFTHFQEPSSKYLS